MKTKDLDEALLLEKTRNELLNKSKNADVVKSYGTTRYGRRHQQHVDNSVNSFNKIDFNALFKADLLSFKIPVHGETNDYEVEILFDGICKDFQSQLKLDDYKLEFKCIYRALINAINRQDIYVSCSCPDFKYRMGYYASKGRYNSGQPQITPSKITNPNDTKGAGCKHIMKVLADLDWVLKLASCITNYIIYMDKNMHSKYAQVIFPAVYGMPYGKALQLGLFDDEDLANTMDHPEDEEEINKANELGDSPEEIPDEELPPDDIEEVS